MMIGRKEGEERGREGKGGEGRRVEESGYQYVCIAELRAKRIH